MKYLVGIALTGSALFSGVAKAEPGLAGKVYGATVEAGVTELELRHGRIHGDTLGGKEATGAEFAHGFTRGFHGGLVVEWERPPGEGRRLESVGIEDILALGHSEALELDFALYGEYGAVRGGADEIEAKLLVQHRRGPMDVRVNLIAGKELERGEAIEVEYAASADWALSDALQLGIAAFGDLGTTRRFLSRGEHYAGPYLKTEIEGIGNGDLEIEAGYHVAFGAGRGNSDGQFRFVME